jgi:hypothetical protein
MGQSLALGWVAVMLVLIAAVGPGPTPTLGQSAASDADFEHLVRDFYGAVNERRYQDAYAYLSQTARDQQRLDDFARPFEPVISIDVRWVDGVTVEGATASLAAHIATISKGEPPGMGACSRVDWALVFEDGGWKRENASPTAEDCAGG